MESMLALTRRFAVVIPVCLALVSGTAAFAALKTPTVSVTTSAASITTVQPLTVTVTVSGGTGSATAAGTVTLTSGNYTSSASTLAAGKVAIIVGAGLLPVGSDTLTATYTSTGTSTTVYNGASGTKGVTVTLATPMVTVTPSPASITTVQSSTVTVAVSGGAGSPPATGSVTLSGGSYNSGAITLVSGSASAIVPANLLVVGSNTLTATYAPDQMGAFIYKGATGTNALTVAKAAPTVTVNPSSSSITVLQSMTASVHVSGGQGNPTASGTVALTSGTYKPTATTLNSDGNASFSIPAGSLAVGSDTLTVTYTPATASAAVYSTATGTAPVTVAKVVPAVTVTPAAGSITTTQSLQVMIAVTSDPSNPSAPAGTVVLASGTYKSTAATLVSGSVNVTIAAGALAAGADTLTATYTPATASAAAYGTATGTAPVSVSKTLPTVTVAPASGSITTVQALSVPVTVSGGLGNPVPTGTVTLSSGGFTSAAATLAAGKVTISVAAGKLPVGRDTLTVTFTPATASAAVYATGTGTAPETVTLALPTVTVTPTPASITVAQALSVAVVVAGGTGNPVPAGSVTLTSGNYTSSAVALATGKATISVPAGSLAVGTGTLTVTYTSSPAAAPVYDTASGTHTETVTLATPTVTVTPSPASITTVQALAVTVGVSGGTGSPAATGSVMLSNGNYASAPATLASGSALINVSAGLLAAGTDTLTATFTPDAPGMAIYNGATGTKAVTVTKATPTVTVNPTPSPATTLQGISVSVSVSGGNGTPTPTGTVSLTSGTYSLGPIAVNTDGNTFFNIPAGSLPGGSDTLKVTYTPDQLGGVIYNGASGTAALTMTKATPFIIVSPGLSSITTTQVLQVQVGVSGSNPQVTRATSPVGGPPVPTGSVTLSSGTYKSTATTLVGGGATINIPAGSLAAGSDTLTATYTPDTAGAAVYNTGTSTAPVTVAKTIPIVTVSPAQSSIPSVQALSVPVTVSGGQGNPVPAGTVTLTSGTYSSAAATLASGSATISIPAGKLPASVSDTLTVTYTPATASAAVYGAATGTATVDVTMTPTVTVTPGVATVTTAVALAVPVYVSGGPGKPIPSGTVTLTSGSYTGGPTVTNADGNAFFTIPAGMLAVGTADVLTATYAPDQISAPIYNGASGTHNVAVTQAPVYTLTVNSTDPATGVSIGVSPADKNGASDGTTSFTRSYVGGTVITLSAPQTAGTNIFSTFSNCAPTVAANVCTIMLTGNTTVTAYYTVYTGPTITTAPALPAGFPNTNYSALVTLVGGTGPFGWTVNGNPVPTVGVSVDLGSGLNATNYGDNNLYIGGTPTAADSYPYTVQFTASVVDSSTPAVSAKPVQFTINVYAQGYTVSGNINSLTCGGNGNSPSYMVSIDTNPMQTTYTDGSGYYSFQVPAGSYTVTPSITGPTAIFYPPSQAVMLNSDHQSVNAPFQSALGYTVTGTVAYSGSKTGRIYISLSNNNCGGGTTPGTSLSAAGTFTIHGVPPGNYDLNGWMDTQGTGAPNAANPLRTISKISIPIQIRPTLTGPKAKPEKAGKQTVSIDQTLTLADPGTVTLSSPPSIQGVSPFSGGAVIAYKPIQNSDGVEMATSYTVQWSTTLPFPATVPAAQTKTFKAVGGKGASIWIIGSGLTNTSKYYFRAQGVAGSSASSWATTTSTVTIGAPTGGNSVTGKITFSTAATGPLYTGYYDQGTGAIYVTSIATPSSPAAFTVNVPSGTNYFHFAILDQNKDGIVDAGDLTNTDSNSASETIPTGNTSDDLTLPSGNSTVVMATQHQQQTNHWGTSTSYNLQFGVETGLKLPVAVQLTGGPNVIWGTDIGPCSDCGGSSYDFGMGIGTAVPSVGDTYSFLVTYADASSETKTVKVSSVITALPTDLQPAGQNPDGLLKPTFSWDNSALAGSDTYQFQLMDTSYNTIWQIPGNNSKSNGFSSAITSLDWGVDPTNSNSTPSVTALTSGTDYYWQVQASDANGNTAQAQVEYYPGYHDLMLPDPGAAKLPQAAVGQSYSATIAATGGYPCYSYNVNSDTFWNDGFNWNTNGSCGSPLIISGIPNTTGTMTFEVTAYDSINNQQGVKQTYTINILAALPVSLPTSTPSSLGPGLIGFGYSGAVNASGGVSLYSFTVNDTPIPNTGAVTPIAGGNGLTAYNGGGNTLFFGGTPTAGPITLTVSVTDGNSTTDTETYNISVSSGPNGANNSHLNGQYTCLTQGFNDQDGARWASVATFKADGSGNLTSGEFDENGSDQSSASTGTSLSGTYSIGADNNGLMSITATPGPTTQWAIALTDLVSPAQQFRMVEADSSSTLQHGTANCFLATTSAFAASTISGNSFAFQFGGENPSGNSGTTTSSSTTSKAAVGRFTASSGSITAGLIDMAKSGCTTAEEDTFTGTYTSPDANGRLYLTLTPTQQTAATCPSNTTATVAPAFGLNPKPEAGGGGGSVTLAVYIVDANRMFIMETTAGDGLFAGNVRKQLSAPYSNSSIKGPFVLYMQGSETTNNGMTGSRSQLFQGTGDGAGNLTVNASYSDKDGTYSVGDSNGGPIPVVIGANGLTTLKPGNGEVYMELFGIDNTFIMSVDGDGSFESGWVEPQVQPASSAPFGFAYIKGTYLIGQMPAMDPTQNGNVGEFTLDQSGNISGAISQGGESGLTFDQSMNLSYTWDSTTYGSFIITDPSDTSGKGGISCVAINAQKFACTMQSDKSPSVLLFQQ